MGFKRNRSKRRSGEEKIALYIECKEEGLDVVHSRIYKEFRSFAHFKDYVEKSCKICYINSFHGSAEKISRGGVRIKDEKVIKESRGSKVYPFMYSEEEIFELKDMSNRYSYEEVKKEGEFYKKTYTDLELVAIEHKKKTTRMDSLIS